MKWQNHSNMEERKIQISIFIKTEKSLKALKSLLISKPVVDFTKQCPSSPFTCHTISSRNRDRINLCRDNRNDDMANCAVLLEIHQL